MSKNKDFGETFIVLRHKVNKNVFWTLKTSVSYQEYDILLETNIKEQAIKRFELAFYKGI